MMKSIFFSLFFLCCCMAGFAQDAVTYVSLTGNAYITSPERDARITGRGLARWTSPATVVSVYFYMPQRSLSEPSYQTRNHLL